MEPVELCKYIKEHSSYHINQGIKNISANWNEWMIELKQTTSEAEKLGDLILETFREIEDHLRKKEKIFYPFVEVLTDWMRKGSKRETSIIKNPIAKMIDEQQSILRKISNIRQITSSFNSSLCKNKVCVLCMTELFGIEQELNKEFHIEQTILFPKLLEMEVEA